MRKTTVPVLCPTCAENFPCEGCRTTEVEALDLIQQVFSALESGSVLTRNICERCWPIQMEKSRLENLDFYNEEVVGE